MDVAPKRRQGYAIAPSDGSPLYYQIDQGAGPTAPTIVLSDGIGCDGYAWKYIRKHLSDRFRVVHWHYRGHGRTPNPRDPSTLTIPDFADDLSAVVADSDSRDTILVGHSMGVQVSLEAYRRHPQGIRALVLICGASSHPLRTFHGSAALETIVPRVHRAVQRAPKLFAGFTRNALPSELAFEIAKFIEVNGELIDRRDFMPYLRGLSRIDVSLFLSLLTAAGEHSADEILPTIQVPVLVIGGQKDGFTPPDRSRNMANAIPTSELLVVEDGSHTTPIERPTLVIQRIDAFLATHNLLGQS